MFRIGSNEGRKGNYNQWVIDKLVEGDVVVADMYDKVYKGTFWEETLQQLLKTEQNRRRCYLGRHSRCGTDEAGGRIQVYYRGIDPTPIRNAL